MSNLEYTPLPELLKKIVDNRGKSVPVMDSGFPLIATNCIKHSSIYPTFDNIRYVSEETLNTWFRAHLEPHDILFVNKGTPGRTCLVPDPVSFCAAQDMMAFRCDETKIYYKYLFAVLRSNWMRRKIENYHVGLVIPHFKKQDLNSLLIPNKSEKEQKVIGDTYVGLSEKIELNNNINQELEAMAKTLYDYWFVQFDFPDADGKPYKSTGGKMVYSEELNREIPEGWEVFPLSAILKSNYLSIGKDDVFEEIEYLDTSSLTKNELDTTVPLKPKRDKIPSRAKRIVNTNDILYSTVRPNLCHYGIIKNPLKNMIASTGFVQLASKISWISNDLIYTFLTSPWITDRLQQIASSAVSSYPSISPNDILELNIALPKNSKGLKFTDSIFDSIYSKTSLNQKENQKLTQLRDWLLPMLMNGQVKVS